MARWVYRLDLTPHEREALLTLLADYIVKPDAIEVSIDATTGEEIRLETFVGRVLNIDPTQVEE